LPVASRFFELSEEGKGPEHLQAMVPDVGVLLDFEPERLGAKLLFTSRQQGSAQFHLGISKTS
jgi:hypothetical protein